tara:strand:+ start:251 stop:652 length:402 start_codon:yes stop_codon:yes gene_type:complete
MKKSEWMNENIYLVNTIFNKIILWLQLLKDVYIYSDIEDFYDDFVDTIYSEYILSKKPINNNLDEESSEYFELKYSEDITDLYIESKAISNNMCSNLFTKRGDTSDTFVNLIQKHIYVNINKELDSDSESEID